MSTTSVPSDITLVDSDASLLPLLGNFASLTIDPPCLYISLEEIALGCHDSISILSLYIAPTKKTYLIDIYSLNEAAFSETTNGEASLKFVLESSTIPKVVFDIRNCSNVLSCLFHIAIDGIKDLQFMELACRKGSRNFVSALINCVEKDSPISAQAKREWHRTREHHLRLFALEKEGHNEILSKRSLKPEIIQYCKQNVMLLPGLYNVYSVKLCAPGQAFWRVHVREATKIRIKLSQGSDYDDKSRRQTLGWDDKSIDEATEAWNDEIMMEAMTGEMVLNEEDHSVAAPNDDDDFWNRLDDEYTEQESDWYQDTEQDCIGWEEDMIKNGELF